MALRGFGARIRYRLITAALSPFAGMILRRRRAKGKEHPVRWREKLGRTMVRRPEGALVWLHGVGLGEVLSARPVVAAMLDRDPDLNFLITSSTRASSDVINTQMPDRSLHQFLPLDTPGAVTRFLDHWDPDLSVWIEQDMWPGLVLQAKRRGIPLALINGRMQGPSVEKRRKARRLYESAYGAFDLITAQDATSADHLAEFHGQDVPVLPNLKSIAPALDFDPQDRADWADRLHDRAVWVAGSAHMADVAQALAAHKDLLRLDPRATLIILPRYIEQSGAILDEAAAMGLLASLTTDGRASRVLVEPRFGQSGLWYSLGAAALIGGGFDDTGGHNPWEAIHMGCGVLFGPNTANFADEYEALQNTGAAIRVGSSTELTHVLTTTDFAALAKNGNWTVTDRKQQLAGLFDTLTAMVRRRY